MKMNFAFHSLVWRSPGPHGWHFVTLPKDMAGEIRFFARKSIGFGTIRVDIRLGSSTWQSSLFPDKKSDSYLLPINSAIRIREGIEHGDRADIQLDVNFA